VEAWENQTIDSTEIIDDVTYLFGAVTVAYDKSQVGGKFFRVTDSTYATTVLNDYQIRNTVEIEALVTTSGLANSMAAGLALDFSTPTRIVRFRAAGDSFFALQPYDVGVVNTYPDDEVDLYTLDPGAREFAGVLVVQVLSVSPDYQNKSVEITARVLQGRPFTPVETTVILTTDDKNLASTDDRLIVGGN